MPRATRPNELSASEARRLLAAGDLTCETLVRACLERIEAREPELRAFVWLEPERALEAARRIDRAGRPGPLHGLPVGVKDVMATADMPTQYNSPIYAGHRPDADADCVRRLKAAGGLVLGKTVTAEFAVRFPGPTCNPHDPKRTPGGSSSGSAAAVADRMIPLAIGTQTSGSISRPASFCGVVGYKPSFARHDLAGVSAVSPSLDTMGFFARKVADTALFSAALLGEREADLAGFDESPPTVGLCRTPWWDQAEAGTVMALEAVADAAGRQGAKLREVELPTDFAEVVAVHRSIMDVEATHALARVYPEHRARISPDLLAILDRGATAPPGTRAAMLERVEAWRPRLAEAFAKVDVLVAPSAKGEAPPGLDSTGDPLFTRIWTLFGVPTVTLPAARGPAGMPVAIEMVGPPRDDSRALAAAAWMERALASEA
jgi:Asp-tRNA(Asn)/Glu-tRNA(Gln) amidotransferase A subunit family amidase